MGSKANVLYLDLKGSYLHSFTLILLVFSLGILNWSLEAIKWSSLIKKVHELSISKIVASILLGITANLLAPNRTGDLAGRLKYIPASKRSKVLYLNFFNASSQLLMTYIFGLLSLFFFAEYIQPLNNLADTEKLLILVALISVGIILFFRSNLLLNTFIRFSSPKVEKASLPNLTNQDRIRSFGFSAARYVTFLLQFYLILRICGMEIGIIESSMALAFIFFSNTFIPSNWLVEILSKGTITYFVFQLLGYAAPTAVTATILLWFVNIALPSILGVYYVKDINWIRMFQLNRKKC